MGQFSPITTPPARRRFAVYDLEWVPSDLTVRLVGTYDGNRYRSFLTVIEFLRWALTTDNRGIWFYAHAGGLADVQFILRCLVEHGPRDLAIECSFSGSSAIIVHVRRGKNVWHFVDSYWLLRTPLAKIGKAWGYPKTGPAENSTEEQVKAWYATVPLAELHDYNQVDCEILYNAIRDFQIMLLSLGGQLNMTAASSAMQLFRRRYLKRPIGTSDKINAAARCGYVASRVEVFSRDMDAGYYYDVNSSFPYSMTGPVPGSLCGFSDGALDESRQCWIADVDIHVPYVDIPPLPTRLSGRVFFPTGDWSQWINDEDLRLLYECGGSITGVRRVYYFEARDDMAEFAQTIYDMRRKASSEWEKECLKIVLNSLYGKTAERRDKERVWIRPPASYFKRMAQRWNEQAITDASVNPSAESYIREHMIMPGVFLEPIEVELAHEHVPIAMQITARSRALLTRHLWDARSIAYCDTDGFATDTPFLTGDHLGALKLEKIVKSAEFVGPKFYKLDLDNGKTMHKAKGFSLGKRHTAERWETLAAGLEIEVDRMVRIRENLNSGRVVPVETVITKRLQNITPKRFTFPDGSTRPWDYSELTNDLHNNAPGSDSDGI